VIVAVAVVVATAAGLSRPARYGAEAEVLYGVPSEAGSRADVVLATQRELAQARRVTEAAAKDAAVNVRWLEQHLTVRVVTGTQVLRFTVTAPTPVQARQAAQAVVDRYVTAANEQGSPAKQFITNRITELSAELTKAQERAVAGDKAAVVQVTLLTQRLETYQSRLTDVEVAQASAQPALVVTPAHALEGKVSPKPVRSAALGGLIGAIIAGAVWFLAVQSQPQTAAGAVPGAPAEPRPQQGKAQPPARPQPLVPRAQSAAPPSPTGPSSVGPSPTGPSPTGPSSMGPSPSTGPSSAEG
jgi:uncharacterized protein involved in exopolysaccharide biosynthesis